MDVLLKTSMGVSINTLSSTIWNTSFPRKIHSNANIFKNLPRDLKRYLKIYTCALFNLYNLFNL